MKLDVGASVLRRMRHLQYVEILWLACLQPELDGTARGDHGGEKGAKALPRGSTGVWPGTRFELDRLHLEEIMLFAF